MRILMQMLDWFMSPVSSIHYRSGDDIEEYLDCEARKEWLDFAGLCCFMFFLFVVLGVLL